MTAALLFTGYSMLFSDNSWNFDLILTVCEMILPVLTQLEILLTTSCRRQGLQGFPFIGQMNGQVNPSYPAGVTELTEYPVVETTSSLKPSANTQPLYGSLFVSGGSRERLMNQAH